MGEQLPPQPTGQPSDQRPSQPAAFNQARQDNKIVLSDPNPATLTPEPYDSTFVVPPTPPKKRGLGWSRQRWLIAISALAIAGLLIGVAWGLLNASDGGTSKQAQTPTAGQQIQTPLPTPTPRPTPTPVVKTVNSVTVSPARFILPLQCQQDNGFRCTMTLSADRNLFGLVSISIVSPPSGVNVNATQMTLSAGQKKQLIISVHHECAFDATLAIFINLQRLNVPLTCKTS